MEEEIRELWKRVGEISGQEVVEARGTTEEEKVFSLVGQEAEIEQ